MAIDILRNHAIQAMPEYVANRTKLTAKSPESVKVDTLKTPSEDDVVLTAAAQTFSQALSVAQESDGVDHDKVAYFKQQVANGSYKADAERTASKMLEESESLSFLLD